jgi:ribosomal protein S6
MKNYELLLIISGKLQETEIPAAIDEIKKVFTKYDVKIVDENIWGNMRLAYEIKHQRTGTYVLWHVSVENTNVAGLNRDLQVTDNVLRFLFVEQPTHGKTITPPNLVVDEKETMADGKGGKDRKTEKAAGKEKTPAEEKAAPKEKPVKEEKVDPVSTAPTEKPDVVDSAKKPAETSDKTDEGEDLDKKLDDILNEQI